MSSFDSEEAFQSGIENSKRLYVVRTQERAVTTDEALGNRASLSRMDLLATQVLRTTSRAKSLASSDGGGRESDRRWIARPCDMGLETYPQVRGTHFTMARSLTY